MPTPLLIALWLVMFAISLLTISLGLKYMEMARKKKVSNILSTAAGVEGGHHSTILMDLPRMAQTGVGLATKIPGIRRLARLLEQAGMSMSPVFLLSLMVALGLAGVFLGSRVDIPLFRELSIAVAGLTGFFLPLLVVLFRRSQRISAFEEELPEALDFLARSMRAGHAFSVSLEMLAEEAPQPLGFEFRRLFHEQNLGAPLEVALPNLARRVPLLDVRFFVSAVLLQRETGGNLAEILNKLAYVIRERFRLKGQVRAASAHGRLSAIVLSVLPIVTTIGLIFVAPGYLESMAADPDGKRMIIGAIIAQFIGYYCMKRIISIKV